MFGTKQDQSQSEQLLQQICDTLVAAGYFRARLNISPFDKVLGAMCWAITGSNNDIDIEFMDDMTLGEKVQLSEVVVKSLQQMECPHVIFPHQIKGLDFNELLPVVNWLIKKLQESRDTRGAINRKMGLLNYKVTFDAGIMQDTYESDKYHKSAEQLKMKDVIFSGKPKRVYKTNRNSDVSFQDPKRVHTALREFNDLSANSVFQGIIDQIQQLEKDQKSQNLAFKRRPTVAPTSKNMLDIQNAVAQKDTANDDRSSIVSTKSGLATSGNMMGELSIDIENATQEEIVANVEKMIQQEQKKTEVMKKDKKAKQLDLNVGVVSAKAAAAVKAMPSISSASGTLDQTRASETQSVSMSMDSSDDRNPSEVSSASATAKKTVRIAPTTQTVEYDASEEKFGSGILDSDVSLVRRKTIAIKSDNINEAFLQNMTAITESVNTFQKMSEDTFKNDASLIYQTEKDNYEKQMKKLAVRIDKQTKQKEQIAEVVTALQAEVEQLEYEQDQYAQKMVEVKSNAEQVESQISSCTVKEHEITAVNGLVEEKARLAEAKTQLKKNCKEEKKRIDQELERMRVRREELEQEEQAAILKEIDDEFDTENTKLVEQKKLIAQQNRQVAIFQRKVESVPSKIEITQFHKRFVELFDNLNFKSDESRKYFNLYNTAQDAMVLFNQQQQYMNEIKNTYEEASKEKKSKKAKEVLLHNLRNILGIIGQNVQQAKQKLEQCRQDYKNSQTNYDECIRMEKDHFIRIKEFESACDKNDELRAKLGM